jgi:hypothetical protein
MGLKYRDVDKALIKYNKTFELHCDTNEKEEYNLEWIVD